MLRFVTPHDLNRICLACGIDLCGLPGTSRGDLSNATGISEEELLAVSSGAHALSAEDSLLIIMVLAFSMPEGAVFREAHENNEARRERALMGYRQLLREADEEGESALDAIRDMAKHLREM